MKNKDHPILKRQLFEKVEYQYCPKCEISYFMTNSEMMKHLENHQKKYEEGLFEEADILDI